MNFFNEIQINIPKDKIAVAFLASVINSGIKEIILKTFPIFAQFKK